MVLDQTTTNQFRTFIKDANQSIVRSPRRSSAASGPLERASRSASFKRSRATRRRSRSLRNCRGHTSQNHAGREMARTS